MAEHVAWGRLTMPIAAIYPLEQVRAAYTELAGGHVPGKIVLSTVTPAGRRRAGGDTEGLPASSFSPCQDVAPAGWPHAGLA